MKKNKKGFTLVELLAVIVILAIILVIAVPQIMSTIENARKGTLESTAKLIAGTAEKRRLENQTLGIEEEIDCEDIAEYNDEDYASCDITFDENGKAIVTIVGSGKFEGMNVCNGTKTDASATNEECGVDNKEPTVEMISFTLGGVEYQAEMGMNWYDFVDMNEANGNYEWLYIMEYVQNNRYGTIYFDNSTPVNPSNDIVAGHEYLYEYEISANLITFSIANAPDDENDGYDRNNISAESGMTYAEWAKSEYYPSSFSDSYHMCGIGTDAEGYLIFGNAGGDSYMLYEDGTKVLGADVIENGVIISIAPYHKDY